MLYVKRGGVRSGAFQKRALFKPSRHVHSVGRRVRDFSWSHYCSPQGSITFAIRRRLSTWTWKLPSNNETDHLEFQCNTKCRCYPRDQICRALNCHVMHSCLRTRSSVLSPATVTPCNIMWCEANSLWKYFTVTFPFDQFVCDTARRECGHTDDEHSVFASSCSIRWLPMSGTNSRLLHFLPKYR